MTDERTFVVVGGGLAGAKTAEALRERGFEGRVVLFGAEQHLPYERPPLSKGYLKTGESSRTSSSTTRTGMPRTTSRCAPVHGDRRRPRRQAGGDRPGEQDGYDRLLLATGSSPRGWACPAPTSRGALAAHHRGQHRPSGRSWSPGARVVFVGGGWIGLEVASAAREAGAEVTVLESLELPLVRVLGPQVAQVFADLHREHGVDLRTGVTVEALEGDTAPSPACGWPTAPSCPRRRVVVGHRRRAQRRARRRRPDSTSTTASRPTPLGRTSDPDIFAVGDVANVEHPFLGRRVRVEHWANALNQPQPVAAAMLDQEGPDGRAALLLHRPVRPRHGVPRSRRAPTTRSSSVATWRPGSSWRSGSVTAA